MGVRGSSEAGAFPAELRRNFQQEWGALRLAASELVSECDWGLAFGCGSLQVEVAVGGGGGTVSLPPPSGFCTNNSFVKGTGSDVHIKQGLRRREGRVQGCDLG